MQPPETEPTVSPRPLMAMSEPGGRGDEPQVRVTVTSNTGRPVACQACAARRTWVSRSSMVTLLSMSDQTSLNGSSRSGLPVRRLMALAKAGASGGRPGSPMPVGGSALGTVCTLMAGISVRRATV
ncbi:hypothetical protein FQZ97_649360 [compost metagenome]